jgi:uncharacterized protein YydD (DUF2326 family)
MKLSQLYANKNFKNIKFNDGINLVLGKVTKKLDYKKDSHNLGKTTLIAVIDFMLLKENLDSHIFNEYKDKFVGYVFFLEIQLNKGGYLTIRRGIDNHSKVSFKLTDISHNCLNEEAWDRSNLAIKKAKDFLNEQLAFNILEKYDFRKSVTYLLRSQKDYNDVFQLAKFSKGKHEDWKPFIFDMLGFNGSLLEEKYEADNDIAEQKSLISGIKNKFSVDTEEIDKIKGAIEIKREEQKELQEQIDNFNFYQQERKLNRELIEDIEKRISELNTVEYNLDYDLEKLNESLSNHISFDIEQLKRIYADSQIYFPENLTKDYKQLEDFNKRITEERNKYLKEKLIETTEKLKTTRISLQAYDNKRNTLLSVLKDKDSFKKFKTYQIDLTKVEGDISRLEEKLKSINTIDTLNEQVKKMVDKLDNLKEQINHQINSDENKIYPEIRRIFRNIFKYIFNTPALIYIKQNGQGNVEFEVEVSKENEIEITAEGKGNTYQKMLCISFDLALLVAYYKFSFYRFVYHDGSLEGLDNRRKIQYLNLIRDYCTKYNIQYILTSIQDDIPPEVLKTFKKPEICLTLDDSGDKGRLFEMSF